MMSVTDLLRERGWHVSQDSSKEFEGAGKPSKALIDSICKKLLDLDLKTLGEACLPTDINDSTSHVLTGCYVLQIVSVKSVCMSKDQHQSYYYNGSLAVPNSQQQFVVKLTDGNSSCKILDINRFISKLSIDTPQGTKVVINPNGGEVPVLNGFIVPLSEENVKVLGGTVEELFEKWRLNRQNLMVKSSGRQAKGSVLPQTDGKVGEAENAADKGGPPAFVPFELSQGQGKSGRKSTTKSSNNGNVQRGVEKELKNLKLADGKKKCINEENKTPLHDKRPNTSSRKNHQINQPSRGKSGNGQRGGRGGSGDGGSKGSGKGRGSFGEGKRGDRQGNNGDEHHHANRGKGGESSSHRGGRGRGSRGRGRGRGRGGG